MFISLFAAVGAQLGSSNIELKRSSKASQSFIVESFFSRKGVTQSRGGPRRRDSKNPVRDWGVVR
jgi:hypothetical protein